MTTAPEALERSVLEAKERDELAVIAEALGLKPTSRAKKSDLVDQILQGIGVEGAEEKPKKARAPRKKAAAASADGPSESAAVAVGDAPAEGSANGAGAPAEAPAAPEVVASAVAPASEATPTEAPAEAEPAASNGAPAPAPAPVVRERQNQQNQPRQGGGGGGGGGGQGQGQGGGQGGQGEPGNRRSRRRRGRDRGPGGDRGPERFDDGRPEQPYTGEVVEIEGLLDLRDEGYGFLRSKGFLASNADVYVSVSQVRRFALRKGDFLKGGSRPANTNEKYPALVRIDTVNGMDLEAARGRPRFDDLTPLFPDEKLRLEIPGDSANMVARIVDLISPIGKGQRGMIVSPPKAGKTTVLKQIAHSIEANNPEVHLMVLLVDERPEEVTDMRRSVKEAEVVASTFDRPSDEHTQVAELAIERAKRLVELGRDVVIVLDGITRLARAYNLAAPATGRIMSGGVDSGALYPPKKFFGAARNIEEGGSLTILATALVETGSRMDEVIFEEFKGTGNMELRLDRKLAERRVYPAIDVNASSTRHEELLFERKQLELVWRLRRVLNGLSEGGSTAAGLELLMDKIKTTKSNDEFLAEIAKAPSGM
jgi:transcription termination factor Rho